ncbi:MAG: carbamoyltransferase N-terminal domain-containing protein [Vicinamibacterales bacterium]
MTAILGISAFYHDSAACLVVDGNIAAAAQEERFTRKKYDARFPVHAIRYGLNEARVAPADLDYIAFYDKPIAKFERLLETYLEYAPAGFDSFSLALPVWLKKKLFTRRAIQKACQGASRARYVFLEHHESHAASAFFPSPFEEAAILTLDGVGEWTTAAMGVGTGNRLELTQELRFPHSLGLLYSAFTYYCGFAVNSGEYKLMGLAPYGKAVYKDLIYRHLLDVNPDGSFWLDMSYFNYCQGLTMTNRRFHELFGGPPRKPDTQLERRHMDLASSIQSVTEDIVLRLGQQLHRQTGMKKLVMAGGVALNCVANGRLLREGPYSDIWIQPAAGDAGGSLGAALFVWHQLLGRPRTSNGHSVQGPSLLGPAYTTDEIEGFLRATGACYRRHQHESELLSEVTQALVDGKVVGWFHGRMEFGPRALGARSILGDPRSPKMQSTMNVKIKFRESFRPFAPCVLREHVHEWFGMRPNEDSPYMLQVAPVLTKHRVATIEDNGHPDDPDLRRRVSEVRSSVPAITHVDYSARVQTIDQQHGRFRRLLQSFYEKTGCPILVNTSFNLSWEPIVMRPEEAYHTFMQSEMDVLVLEDCVLHKEQQRVGFQCWTNPGEAVDQTANPWRDPISQEPLLVTSTGAENVRTGKRYAVEEGIPRLFVTDDANTDDVTEIVKRFYEKTPFPNYDDVDSQRALLDKARAGRFAKLLNEQIPYSASVLEVGCGTGQLTNFLSIAHRSVLGVDVCLNSLRLAQRFKETHGIERATFAQMNLFRPALQRRFFDVVVTNGVLHHTGDCRLAFQRVGELVRPGGFFIVGLYSAFSRQLHYARRALFRWTGITGTWLDPHFGRVAADGKREAWFQDQYCHPHESCHTLDEVIGWLEKDGFDFINSIPKPRGGPELEPHERLFEPHDRGNVTSRISSQLASLGSGYREGGFFIVIGRRRA